MRTPPTANVAEFVLHNALGAESGELSFSTNAGRRVTRAAYPSNVGSRRFAARKQTGRYETRSGPRETLEPEASVVNDP
jgi:hypothetical protein